MPQVRNYTVTMALTTVTAANTDVDYVTITPADDKPVGIAGFIIGQKTEVGDSAEEMLQISIRRLPSATITGGTSTTPRLVSGTGSASGATVTTANTTVATTAGTNELLYTDTYNVRIGKEMFFPPEFQFEFSGAETAVLRQESTVTDDVDITVTLFMYEVG